MEITVETLNKLLIIFTEDYEEEKRIYDTSRKLSEKLDSLSELQYLKGQLKTLKVLKSILEDDGEAIRLLKEFIEVREYLRSN